tara:strand:- start:532 stop:708 length:177 start_codon:yes stop_codon:yes gene_type:complete
MDNKLKELVEDLDEVMTLIRKIGEATDEDVESLKEDIKLTHDKIKSKYGQENSSKTDS